MGCDKKQRNRKKDREKPLNKNRARTIEFNKLRADEEVRKRVDVLLAKTKTKNEEVIG